MSAVASSGGELMDGRNRFGTGLFMVDGQALLWLGCVLRKGESEGEDEPELDEAVVWDDRLESVDTSNCESVLRECKMMGCTKSFSSRKEPKYCRGMVFKLFDS
jgi:hypothetical protein